MEKVDVRPIRRALISVSDKTDLYPLARELANTGVDIISSGNTARHLRELGIRCSDVSDYTGYPELFSGRLKTLHPKVHGGILYQRHRIGDQEQAHEHSILEIDLVIVNLYPFADVASKNATLSDLVENIDIGGPTLIRSAAKNHLYVTVLSNPNQYDEFIEHHRHHDGTRKNISARTCGKGLPAHSKL